MKVKEYALYKGDILLSIGTIKEIAEDTGVKTDTIYYYKSNVYKRRLQQRNSKNARTLIELDIED